MGHQTRRETIAVSSPHLRPDHHHPDAAPLDTTTTTTHVASDLQWPFGKLDGIDDDDLRVTAYEIFFTACRSSPGFGGGRNALSYYSSDGGSGGEGGLGSGPGPGPGSPVKASGVGMAVTSRVKTALGLKMLGLRRIQSRRASTGTTNSNLNSNSNSNSSSPQGHNIHHHHHLYSGGGTASPRMGATVPPQGGKLRRPMTSAEMMRRQMKVTEPSDKRLRKTLFRALVGQISRRTETIILPLELLRHLKPSEFTDSHEYHFWQHRQLKILEAGLLLYPSVPLDKSNPYAVRFREIIQLSETKTIDTSKNSESMRNLCNCIISLTWRSHDGETTDVCHWADGFPFNVHIYVALLHSIFDLKDETMVVDEVDELLELMKKTWTTLGINRPIHNLCFTWVLFQQYVETGEVEGDLLCATVAMLNEVANDAKRTDKEVIYVQLLMSVLSSIKKWTEKRLLCYHGVFHKGTVGLMENFLPLVFAATKILEEEIIGVPAAAEQEKGVVKVDSAGNRVDYYIRSSLKYAFAKLLENGNINGMTFEVQEVTEALMQLAKETEDLAMKEKEIFSPVLKKWHPIAVGVAAVTLHICYGTLLKQYLAGVSSLTSDAIAVLQRAGQLENVLVQMVVEDSDELDDGGKTIIREMVPYEVDSIISNLLKKWMNENLKRGKDCLQRAKETETWNPKSKTEPYAQSCVDLMKIAKETVENFFEIPLGIYEDIVHDLAYSLEHLFRDYTTFVASCGSKQSYVPTLPPLTRCSQDSTLFKFWRKASPCSVGVEETAHVNGSSEGNHPRPSTSRGTQRLYIRLNTLHYLLSQIHSLDKTLSLSPRIIPSPHNRFNNHRHLGTSSSYFEKACSSIQAATQHVSEVAAYRLIFLDSNSVFYDSLYVGDVENARIKPALRILKQNLTLLSAIVTDRAQPLATKEVMKASFDAFLTVLLAGGSSRIFLRADHEMIEEDFDGLKRVFATCGEGLIAENVVEKEAEIVEGVIALMGQSTEQLVEDFSIVVCETSGIGFAGAGHKLPMPPTTGRWNRSDPNTILRVLCYRNDRSANQFLKRTFQLAKRR